MTIPMPPRNTTAEVVARAADKCLRLACAKHFLTVPIGDVGEIVSGGTPSTGCSDFWDGDVVWVTPKDLGRPRNVEVDSAERTITDLGLESSSARLLPKGTVLLSSRAPIGHLGIAARPLATNQGFKNIICSKRLNNRFLFHILRGSIDELAAEGRGNTFMEIPGKAVKAFPIPLPPTPVQEAAAAFLDAFYLKVSGQREELPELPAPLAELRRVVARIVELASQIHEARTLRHQATKKAEALLPNQGGQVFSRLEARHTPREFSSFSPHVTSGPRNWAKHYERDGFRFYRAQDVGPEGKVLDGSKVFITPPPGEQGRSAMLQHGDLMLVITGATVGRVNVYREGLEPGFVSQHVGICRLPQSEVEPGFALWGLRGPKGQAQLLRQRYGQGKPGLNLSNIRALSLPFPPLPEQRRIVAQLDALQAEVDRLKALQAESAAELDAMLPSILDRVFKGQL